MKRVMQYIFILSCFIFTTIQCQEVRAGVRPHDIYLIIYITKSGHTGHVGFAVDNYRVVVRDTLIGGAYQEILDTVKTNTVTYFDLWGPPHIGVNEHGMDLSARYFTLPRSSAEQPIRMSYFLSNGLPHAYDYPCDGLVRIKTKPSTDLKMRTIAEQVQQEKDYFNSRKYNCTDYVITCLNRLFNVDIDAKEFIPFDWSSTPNRFYKAMVAMPHAEIIKDPGERVNNSFVSERIIKSEIFNQTNYEKTHE